ncbi:uncharacterized protein At1g76070-like [Typha angustifolia]|uniref:uncharacterized protein At1g76070-like n=1 Tax=Typha angustifolia TaxID=59011 RepID=UPI003C300C7A
MVMEKPPRSSKSSSLFNFLSKPSSFSIPYPKYNPKRENNPHKHKSFNSRSTFSGPIVSLVPVEARRKEKKGDVCFDVEEPTSPKVSCMGQVKLKKKACRDKSKRKPQEQKEKKKKKKPSLFGSNTFHVKERPQMPAGAPAVGEMRRFASGRERLGDFDWKMVERKVKVAPGYCNGFEDDDDDYDDDEVIIAHSAPMVLGGGGTSLEKEKEVCLWKRRTMARPPPLQIK